MDAPALTLAQRFERFAAVECDATEPLYRCLAQTIAQDAAFLALAAALPAQQPVVLFLGVLHYLLLQQPSAPLAAFYPTCTPHPRPATPEALAPALRAFGQAHAATIRELLQTRRLQTNEVRRCAVLVPAFLWVSARTAGQPLAMLEVGASAGLNLLWEQYGYDYGPRGQLGPRPAPLQLTSTLTGDLPQLTTAWPTVAWRLGLDLTPVDVRDAAAVRWLQALIWPENTARHQRFTQAVALAQTQPPTVLAGDALALLPSCLAQAPPATVLCVWHSFVLNQFTPAARAQFADLLAAHSHTRPVYEIALEWYSGPHPTLTVNVFEAGQMTSTVLAQCHPHGEWLTVME